VAINNLLCVCVGTAYTADYVENLYRGAKKHTSVDFEFYVYTDNVKQFPQDLGWNFVELSLYDQPAKGWWYKMELFNSDRLPSGNNLYIDLDSVIIRDLSAFWNFSADTLGICHDFNRQFSQRINLSNSSVMTWKTGSLDALYDYYCNNQQEIFKRFRGDQDLIHKWVNDKTWFPAQWAMSWRWEIKNGGLSRPQGSYVSDKPYIIPDATKIIVCHGKPKPHEISELKHLWHK